MLEKLLRTFYNTEKYYSEEVRIEALSMIMDKFMFFLLAENSPTLENIFIVLSENSKSTKEFIYFCQQIIFNKFKENSALR